MQGDVKGGRNTIMLTHLDLLEGTQVRLTRNLSVHNGLTMALWVPMFRLIPITSFVGATVNNSHYHHLQLSLLPAHARAGHSVQGMTARDGLF